MQEILYKHSADIAIFHKTIYETLELPIRTTEITSEGIKLKGENLSEDMLDTIANAYTTAELEVLKERAYMFANSYAENALKEFESDALGGKHIYDLAPHDQLNLTSLLTLKVPEVDFKCRGENESLKTYKKHTQKQLQQVFKDGAIFKQSILHKAQEIKEQIHSASSKEQVKEILQRLRNEAENK